MIQGNPCSCGGENPNCFKCDGTAFYSADTNNPAHYDQPFRAAGPHEPTPVNHSVPSKSRGRRGGDGLQRSTVSRAKTCIVCGEVFMGYGARDAHMHSAHPLPVRKPKKPSAVTRQLPAAVTPLRPVATAPMGASPTKTHQCAVCKKWFRGQVGLTTHSDHVHGGLPKVVKHAVQVREQPNSGLSRRASLATMTNYNHQPNLDATKDYYGAYREENRYGSHPSHDDFGDESAP